MRKNKFLYLLLFIPFFLCVFYVFTYYDAGSIFYAIVIISYLITIAGIIFFIKYRPFNAWWLPVSFIISPIPIYIYERICYPDGYFMGWWIYMGTAIVIYFYAIPFFTISTIIAIVFTATKIKNKTRKWQKMLLSLHIENIAVAQKLGKMIR